MVRGWTMAFGFPKNDTLYQEIPTSLALLGMTWWVSLCCTIQRGGGGTLCALLSVYLTWYGLPPALLRSATPLINAGGEGVPVSIYGTIQPGDCTTGIPYGHHTSVRYFPQ